jgi:hypothetical protein
MAFVAAVAADARDDQPMPRHAKAVFTGHRFAELAQFAALKLDQLIAHCAVQVIVLGIAVVVLINGPTA